MSPQTPVRARTTTLPGLAVADEHQVVLTRQLAGLDHAVGREHRRAGRDVQAGLDDAVVAEADADAAVRAEQAAFADRDLLLAAARQRAQDRRAAADVAAVADDHAAADAALDHRRAERAGVEVAEALVHHRGALGEVGAETDPRRVGDAHAGRDHVVGHPRELVDAVHGERAAGKPHRAAGHRRCRRRPPAHGRSTRRCSTRRRCRRGSASAARRDGATGGAGGDTRRTARPAVRPRRPRCVPAGSSRGAWSSVGVAHAECDFRSRRSGSRRRRTRPSRASGTTCRAPMSSDATSRDRRPMPSRVHHRHLRSSGSGKRITSLIESTPASSITTRSMPMPSPPVGGMPYSSARR